MLARMETIKKKLHREKYKLTPQREATLQVLIENEKSHLSAEEVYLLVKDKAPDTGLATVYRTLDLLSELDILDKINFGDGVARYEIRQEGAKHFHHHLICLECGEVNEIQEDLLMDVEEKVSTKYRFLIKDHRLIFHGICDSCHKQQK